MKRVIVESPLGRTSWGERIAPGSPEFLRNQRYALACALDCLKRGEAPFGSHIIYPLILNDATPEGRRLGMLAGLAWGEVCDAVACYVDLGITEGMHEGVLHHANNNKPIEYRTLGGNWADL